MISAACRWDKMFLLLSLITSGGLTAAASAGARPLQRIKPAHPVAAASALNYPVLALRERFDDEHRLVLFGADWR
jgi:hypothetical protein